MSNVRKCFVVESCDADQEQIFVDLVPAIKVETAIDEVETLRPYATVVASYTLPAALSNARRLVKKLEGLKAKGSSLGKLDRYWDATLIAEGLTRDEDRSLYRE